MAELLGPEGKEKYPHYPVVKGNCDKLRVFAREHIQKRMQF